MKDFMDNEETLEEGQTPAVEENTEEVMDEPAVEENTEEVMDEPAVEENTEEVMDEPAVEETVEEVVEEPVVEETADNSTVEEAEATEAKNEGVADFFKQLWQKVKANKVISIAVAAALVVCASTAITIACLVGGKNPPDTSSSSESSTEENLPCVITFESNGGTTYESFVVEKGALVDIRDYMPTKDGLYFNGWYLDAELTVRASATFEAQGDVTLYAAWLTEAQYAPQYLLTFETNGGTQIEAVSYKANAHLAKPEDPTRENYIFGGWYKDAECTDTKEVVFPVAKMPAKDMTIYAKWIAMNALHFNTNGGNEMASIVGQAGEPVQVETPTKEGYIFEGWYEDANFTKPYTVTIIPSKVVTLYAKWHVQLTDIKVNLHVNFGNETQTISLTDCVEGVLLDTETQEANFEAYVTGLFSNNYLGEASKLADKPLYLLSAWAYDEKGANRFDGVLPQPQAGEDAVELYAVWTRSAAYCEVSFVDGDSETAYFIDKNTAIDQATFDQHLNATKTEYVPQGCSVEGFYSVGGNRYNLGDKVAMDMKLTPYIESANLVYAEVKEKDKNNKEVVVGYTLVGYAEAVQEEYKAKESLLLMVPEYHNNKKVLGIGAAAFKGYPVATLSLPNALKEIGAEAFADTNITALTIPKSVDTLGDNAFTGSTLASLTFDSSRITKLGATVFKNTPYEGELPANNDGFIFLDNTQTIIYGYKGTKTDVTTPSAKTIAGAAFKDCTTLKNVTLHDNVLYVSDNAFENSAIESITLGKSFTNMGKNIFKDCTSLTTVNFASMYNLTYIGEGMFEGCTALREIDLYSLVNLAEVHARAFFGCTALSSVTFSNTFQKLGVSAFENCTSLTFAHFGADNLSRFTRVSDRAFAGCTSLKRVMLRGDLINYACVSFGAKVFEGAGYMNNGSFVTPVLYVQNDIPDYSDIPNLDDEYKNLTFVERYQRQFKNTEYKNLVIKPIDSTIPVLTAQQSSLTISVNGTVSEADIYSLMTISEDNCIVYIGAIVDVEGNAITATSGTYTFTKAGEYKVTVCAEDECGNVGETTIWIIVKE